LTWSTRPSMGRGCYRTTIVVWTVNL
jgi:hypothetical protein